MKEILEKEGKVKVIFSSEGEGRPYKKHPWIIPIERFQNEFHTGQDLSTEKMLGKEKLTEEERKRYPFVINPENFYRLRDFGTYDLSKPQDRAILNLALLSGRIAMSERSYKKDPEKFLGYIHNPDIQAREENNHFDLVYEAETFIRDWPIEKYIPLILLLNNKITDEELQVPTKGVSPDRQKFGLIKIAREHPDLVLNSSPKKNPALEEELVVLEMVHYGILNKNLRGEFFYNRTYIGNNVDGVRTYFDKAENQGLRDTLLNALREKKGELTPAQEAKLSVSEKKNASNATKEFANTVNAFKVAIMEQNEDEADKQIEALRAMYENLKDKVELPFDMKSLEEMYVEMKLLFKGNKLREELEKLPLEKLHGKITHHSSAYNKDDYQDVWDNKNDLINKMVKFKMNDK